MNKEIITVIELFNKIANKEKLPQRIKYKDNITKKETVYVWCEWCSGYYVEGREGQIAYKFLKHRNEQFYKVLNNSIEILDEENDEFEDIEEINVTRKGREQIFLQYEDKNGEHKYTIRTLDRYFANKFNQLIRNQKKIIERLNKDE